MIYAPQFSPGLRRLPACAVGVFLLLAPALSAQEVRELSVATRLRKEPEGIPLVSLPAGTSVEPKRTVGEWREVVIEGWIFSRSTEKTTRDGFDLVVTTSGGENIRESPNGAVVGRVRTGTLFSKEEVRGTWTRVRRAGWVPREAIRATARKPAAPPRVERPTPSVPQSRGLTEPVESGALPVQAAAPTPPDDSIPKSDRAQVVRETAIFAAPQGGPYGTLQPGAAARVLSRSGDWTRVQFEGWVRESDLNDDARTSRGGVTAAEVRADPRYIGRTVDWRLELIALQTADDLRIEMPKGQLYLLTRGPLPEPGFVYVMVTESQANEFRSLQALQELMLRVTIRAPRTRFLSTPVVQLVSRVAE